MTALSPRAEQTAELIRCALARVEREAGFLLRTEHERLTGEFLLKAAADLRSALATLKAEPEMVA